MVDVGVAELPGMARARGLSRTADVLEAIVAALGPMEPVDAPLIGAASRDPKVNLAELARRGLDPAAAAYLTFLDGTLERGLLAWDLLTGSLRPLEDESGTSTLRNDAMVVASLLPAAAERCVRIGAPGIAAAADRSLTDASFADVRERAERGELSAVLELVGRGAEARELARSVDFRSRFLELARTLDAAHLSTVASAYWRVAAELLGDRGAIPLMVDAYCDAGVQVQVDVEPDVAAYRDFRRALTAKDSAAVFASLRVARPLRSSPYAEAVCLDLEALTDGARSLELATRLAGAHPAWRFAARILVRVSLAAGASPLAALDRYLARFGNDEAIWVDIVSRAPANPSWAPDVRGRALREVYALPHDPNAWRALGQVAGEPLATVVEQEVAQRLLEQSTLR